MNLAQYHSKPKWVEKMSTWKGEVKKDDLVDFVPETLIDPARQPNQKRMIRRYGPGPFLVVDICENEFAGSVQNLIFIDAKDLKEQVGEPFCVEATMLIKHSK